MCLIITKNTEKVILKRGMSVLKEVHRSWPYEGENLRCCRSDIQEFTYEKGVPTPKVKLKKEDSTEEI